jgi:hypothetical protein
LNLREFNLVDIIQDWMSIWPRLLLSMIIGGIVGYVLSISRPPLYEASASLQVSVDHHRALIPDDYTLVRAFDKVRLIFLADETVGKVLQTYSSLGDSEFSIQTVDDFRSSIRLAQRGEGFQLSVYSDSPKEASELVNLWGEVGLAEIEVATRHAMRAAEYQSALYGTWCEITTRDIESESQTIWVCKYGEDQIDPDELEEGILEEVRKSRGILPVFSFSWIEKSSPPEKPITWTAGWFVICGALIGFILTSMLQVYPKHTFGFKS